MNDLAPRNGETILFCAHADVSDAHIKMDGTYHWYYIGNCDVRMDDGTGLNVRLLAICDACNTACNGGEPMDYAVYDARWIGGEPCIIRTA